VGLSITNAGRRKNCAPQRRCEAPRNPWLHRLRVCWVEDITYAGCNNPGERTTYTLLSTFVSFARSLMWAQIHRVQQAANMINVIAYAKGTFDMLGDARTGP